MSPPVGEHGDGLLVADWARGLSVSYFQHGLVRFSLGYSSTLLEGGKDSVRSFSFIALLPLICRVAPLECLCLATRPSVNN